MSKHSVYIDEGMRWSHIKLLRALRQIKQACKAVSLTISESHRITFNPINEGSNVVDDVASIHYVPTAAAAAIAVCDGIEAPGLFVGNLGRRRHCGTRVQKLSRVPRRRQHIMITQLVIFIIGDGYLE
jgi:hypothetical protein